MTEKTAACARCVAPIEPARNGAGGRGEPAGDRPAFRGILSSVAICERCGRERFQPAVLRLSRRMGRAA